MDIPAPRATNPRRTWWWIGAGIVGVLLAALSRLPAAVPEVAFDRVVMDTVRRGSFVRTARGPGTLEPENQVLVPALTSGRVERRLVVPGSEVSADEVLLELSNPEVRLELLDAERQLAQARLRLVDLRAGHRLDGLALESEVAGLKGRVGEERRLSEALAVLVETGGATETEAAAAREKFTQTTEQLAIAARRRAVMDSTHRAAVAAQADEISRLERIAAFYRDRVASLTVRAPAAGVVADLPVEQGQWVNSGSLLARLILEGGLKARIRVPERSANDVQSGQEATIDLRGSTVAGVVRRVDPSASGGTVAVEVAIVDSLPAGARPDLNVEGTIVLGRADDVLHVARPARATANGRFSLYRVDGSGTARRTDVAVGAVSADRIVVVDGLDEGDVVILSDLGDLASEPELRLQR